MHTLRTHHMYPAGHGRRDINMTEGPLLGKIFLFALPLMLTNLLQMLYNATDMMVVSLSAEENAVGAIGVTGALINLILNLFMGLSVGANVVIARRLGAGDPEGASKAVHSALLVSVVMGTFGMIIGLSVSRSVLVLMGAENNLLDLASLYTRIYFCGLPFIAASNFSISIFRAKGDTRTPLIILTISGLLNVCLNLLFVLVAKKSVEGVAVATAVANFVSASLLIFRLSRDDGPCRFSLRRLRLDFASVREMILIGVPAGIQGALFALSNLIIQSSLLSVNNAMVPAGETFQPVITGNTAETNLEGFAYTSTNSICQAAISFTGQNAGAKKYHRIWRVMGLCFLITTLVALGFMLVIFLLRDPLLSLYGIHKAEEGSLARIAYQTAITRMNICFSLYFLLALMESGSGIVRGLGKSMTSTIVALIGTCLLRVVWIFTVFRTYGTLESIYVSYPLSWGLTGICHFICAVVILKRKEKKASEESETITTKP